MRATSLSAIVRVSTSAIITIQYATVVSFLHISLFLLTYSTDRSGVSLAAKCELVYWGTLDDCFAIIVALIALRAIDGEQVYSDSLKGRMCVFELAACCMEL